MGAHFGWRFCPRCASELEHDGARVVCRSCGFEHYANPAAAASALVVDDQSRVLLARRAHEPDAGLWDTPGGFLEEGEHPEDALRRELLEETGLTVTVGDFVGTFLDTYGDGPEASSVVNLVWEASIVAGEPAPADDVAELRWFPLDELPAGDDLAFRWLDVALNAWAASRRARP